MTCVIKRFEGDAARHGPIAYNRNNVMVQTEMVPRDGHARSG